MNTLQQSLVIRTLGPQEWPAYRDIRLRSLADSPDAYGSTLAEEQERSPQAWEARLAAAAVSGRDRPLIAELDGVAVGLVWAKSDASDPAVVNIFQMWVAPQTRGRGVAVALLREAIAWAKSNNARIVQLGVASNNTPAVRLYEREGFRVVGSLEPMRPGSALMEQTMRLDIGHWPCP
jgi:ribosomal protein S18 acetylase RimI-like enzyme